VIFSGGLADKVLDGSKTQTRRPMRTGPLGLVPCQYVEGKTYAIQRKRGGFGVGPRIRILSVTAVMVAHISSADAAAEGFDDRGGFLARWQEFYGNTDGRCWRIEFALVEGRGARGVDPGGAS
jgi:hypothetical protein